MERRCTECRADINAPLLGIMERYKEGFSIKGIVERAIDFFDVSVEEVMSKNRKRPNVFARHMIWYWISKNVSRGLHNKSSLAAYWGVDHSSVCYGIKSIKDQTDVDTDIMERVAKFQTYMKPVFRLRPS